jgi:hypothetical protein
MFCTALSDVTNMMHSYMIFYTWQAYEVYCLLHITFVHESH